MYIQFSSTTVQKFRDKQMPDGYYAEPNDNGVAQVTEEVGTYLVENYESITEYTK